MNDHIRSVMGELSEFTNNAVKINDKGLQRITREQKHTSHRSRLYNIRVSLEDIINMRTFS